METDPELTARLNELAEKFCYRVLADHVELIESAEGVVLELTWDLSGNSDRLGPLPAASLAAWLEVALEGMGWLEAGLMEYMMYPDWKSVVLLLDGIREQEDWYQEHNA